MDNTWESLGIDLRGRTSGTVKTTCPWCSHRRSPGNQRETCMLVNLDDDRYTCFNCGTNGYRTAGQPSAAGSGYGAPLTREERKVYRRPDPPAVPPPDLATPDPLTTKLLAWWAERGISPATLERAGVRWQAKEDGKAEILFPYHLADGTLANIKHRWNKPGGKKGFRLEADCELVFWGLPDCLWCGEVVICEGEPDKLAYGEAGLWNVLSVPNGAPEEGKPQLSYLESGQPIFEGARRIILSLDGDTAGQHLTDELVRRLGREKCYRVDYPGVCPDPHIADEKLGQRRCKDANEVLVHHGADALRRLVAEAKPEPVAGLIASGTLGAAVSRLFITGLPKPVKSGLGHLDDLWAVLWGQLTTVTGVPQSGKSRFLDAYLLGLTAKNDCKAAFFSPENQPYEVHVASMTSCLLGKPFSGTWEGFTNPTAAEVETASADIRSRFHWMDPTPATLDAVLELARALIFREGIRVLVIDPWNRLAHRRPRGMNETDYIGMALDQLSRFARDFDLAVFVAAHPTKLEADPADGTYPVVTPYMISGSSNWFNMADNCLSAWRDRKADDGYVEIHVHKARWRHAGRLGKVAYQYELATGRFTPAALKEGRK